MAFTHVVRQGEHISSIAELYQFQDYNSIWDCPRNAALRDLRKDPHQLLPGDKVFIPNKREMTYKRATGSTHTFTVYVEKLSLRLQVFDFFGQPLANQTGALKVRGTEREVTTGEDGMVEAKNIPRNAREATLEIADYVFPLRIGDLDPPDAPTGESARLGNLGHWWSDPADLCDADGRAFAIELFQHGSEQTRESQDEQQLAALLAQDHDEIA